MTTILNLSVKRTSDAARLPSKTYDTDAGLDFYAVEDTWLKGDSNLLPLGVSIAIPPGYCLVLKDRSGNALKKGMRVAGGVIDSGYTDELRCIIDVINDPEGTGVYVTKGDRVCQGLIIPVPVVAIHEVDSLPASERETAGFGSSGA